MSPTFISHPALKLSFCLSTAMAVTMVMANIANVRIVFFIVVVISFGAKLQFISIPHLVFLSQNLY